MTALASGLPRPLPVVEIRQETPTTKTLVLDGRMAATPGQFVMVWLPGVDEKPFSLADADPITLTIAAVGPFTEKLHRLQVGDRIWLRGPLGRGYRLPWRVNTASQVQHYLLVGGGYGVAPLHYLARRLLDHGHAVSAIIGARDHSQLLLVEAFRALDVPLWLTTEDGSAGLRGLVIAGLSPAMDGVAIAAIFACGPTGMLQALAAEGAARDVPVQLSWEAHMRCGIGLCGSCEMGAGWLACLDGPVLPFNPYEVSALA